MGMRILVTNDDGVDSLGLHVLARAMQEIGEVVLVAPDREYSGASSAFGALHLIHPEVHRISIAGVDEAWSVEGPPALCVMFATLGAFGDRRFDLVVSGINPGANVGRSVYHSGTIGACLTGRNAGISGVAVSQAVEGFGVEGQGWDELLEKQQWDTAAIVASAAVRRLAQDLPAEPVVLNLNVPNTPLADLKGWRRTTVGTKPPRAMSTVQLHPKPGHEGSFKVRMSWGTAVPLPPETDGGTVMDGYVSVSWLGRIAAIDPGGTAEAERGLDELLHREG
jgi:5'-nucleotidase